MDLLVFCEIGKAGEGWGEGELHGTDRPLPMFGDDDLGDAAHRLKLVLPFEVSASMISTALLGCSTARNKGTCGNRLNIRREELEERVLNALRHHLMQPALFKELCDEFAPETNRVRADVRDALNKECHEIKKIDRELEALVELILQVGAAQQINKKMLTLEEQKAELEVTLSNEKEPPPSLHPEMTSYYRGAGRRTLSELAGR